MFNTLAQFGVSLISLIIFAKLLLKFVEKFACKIKISPLIIGTTLIAIGTSLPETFVSISSIIQSVPEISIGDIIGSNISNICLILGLGIILFPIRIGTEKTQRNNVLLLLLTTIFAITFLIPRFQEKVIGLALIIFYIVFLIVEIIWGKEGSIKEDKKALAKMGRVKGGVLIHLVGTVVSITGLIISSNYLIKNTVVLSRVIGISDQVIGLSIIALGTTLPELATTIVSGINGDWKLLYGNIQGSNIYNLSVVSAILIIFGEYKGQVDIFSVIFMSSVILATIILSRKYEGTHIPKIYGFGFLAAYIFYIAKLYKF